MKDSILYTSVSKCDVADLARMSGDIDDATIVTQASKGMELRYMDDFDRVLDMRMTFGHILKHSKPTDDVVRSIFSDLRFVGISLSSMEMVTARESYNEFRNLFKFEDEKGFLCFLMLPRTRPWKARVLCTKEDFETWTPVFIIPEKREDGCYWVKKVGTFSSVIGSHYWLSINQTGSVS